METVCPGAQHRKAGALWSDRVVEDQEPELFSDAVESDQKACEGMQITECLSSWHSDPTLDNGA